MAVAIDVDRLERDIPRDSRLAVDASAAIAYLHGGERAESVDVLGIRRLHRDGSQPGGDVRAHGRGAAGRSIEGGRRPPWRPSRGFLRFFSEIRVVPLDGSTARLAARVRASAGLALPDAAVVATALEHEAPIIVTNDSRWQAALRASAIPIGVCLLSGCPST